MEEFSQWFSTLEPAQKVFWGCALISSAIFLIQAVLTLIGMDHDMDMDVGGDFDGDTMDAGGAMSLFSVRSIVNFFVGFGWTGVGFANDIHSNVVLFVLATIVGLCFSYAYIFLRGKMRKLEHNGAYKPEDSIGKTCDVYLHIPAGGMGKVQVSINGSIHELDAVSNGADIPTGKRVKVVSVDGNVLTVEEVN